MRPLALLGSLLFLSCAHAPPAKTAASVWFPGETRELRASGSDYTGPQIHLRWIDHTWRGDAYGQLVELISEGDKIRGNFGPTPIDLTAQSDADKLTVRGLFRTELADLRISRSAIEGKIGRCSYDLKSEDGVQYTGFRTCRSPTEPARISLNDVAPHPVQVWQVGALLILLSQ